MKFGLEQNIIDKLIAVFEQHSKVDKALVFGSRAKGNYRPDSDIDIAIKGQDLNTDDIIAMSVAFEEKGITHKIDLINYETIKEPDLKDHIKRVGIELYSRWKSVKLQEIVSKLGDGLHGTPEYDIDGEYYFINGNNLIDGKIVIKENTQRVTEQEYLKYKKELNDRTILLGINGTIGNVAIYNGEKCILGKSACYFNVINDVSKDYIKYVVMDKTFQAYIENFANGSTIMNVSLKVVRDYEFALPPIPEQTAIAKILTSLDDKIDLLHRQNKTLEQLAETLFRQWFVEEAEESWEVGTLDDVISVKGGTTPSTAKPEYWDGNINWTSPRDLSNATSIFLFKTERKITEKGLSQIGSGLLPVGTVLLSSRAPIGYLTITEIPVAINQGYIAIVCDKIVSNYFIYLWCKANMETIENAGNGSVFQEISKTSFKGLEILIPSLEKLKEFDKEIEPVFQKIKSNQTQIRILTQTRDALLPKLMSGEVRVSEL